jgi:type I restriction enzyme S subunit
LGYAKARTQKFNAIVRLIVIEPKKYISSKYLEEIINIINFAIESTGVPQLTVPQISSYAIFVPCLEEQTKIANFLSAIDRKIDLVSQQLEQAKAFKKGLLQQMFV